MTTTLERRPRELDPASSTTAASVLIVDDPEWPYARSLSKDKWHEAVKGDDLSIAFLANSNEPSAQAGKLTLFFDGTALKAKLPDGSLALITQLGVGLYQAHDATLDAFAQAASGPDLLAYFSGIDQVSVVPFTNFGRSLIDDTDAIVARGTLGLGSAATRNSPVSGNATASEVVLGSDSRLGGTSDPTLSALAALTITTADRLIYSTGVETFGLAAFTAFARSLVDDADANTMRGTLGLGSASTRNVSAVGDAAASEVVLGSDSRLGGQAADATLTALAGLSTSADQGIYSTGADAFAMFALTAFGRSLLGSAAASNARTTLGLGTAATRNAPASGDAAVGEVVLGNDSRLGGASDPTLSALAALTTAADQGIYATGVDAFAMFSLTAFGRSLLGSAAASNARTTLGLGSLATLSSVGTTELANSAVTYAKVQNVAATDRLLGRATAGAGVVEEIVCTAFARSMLDDANAATVQGTLGLGALATLATVGTTELTNGAVTYAKVQNVSATDKLLGRATAGAGVVEEITCTPFARTFLDDADATTVRGTLGLGTAAQVNTGTGAANAILGNDARLSDARASTWGAITGTLSTQTDLNTALGNKQPLDATLTALAGLATGVDKLPYSTGTDTFAQADLSAFGRSLIDDAAAGNARTTLGLGGAAQLNIGTAAGTAAAGDDARFTDSRPLLAGSTAPNHYFTEQTAVTTTPYTLVVGDSGTVIPMNAASGVVTIPTYAAGFKGFACEVYAVQATTVNGTTTGSMAMAVGESCHIRAISGGWKVSKLTATAFT